MVVFNPAVPDTNDPSYLQLSRPISQPESDKSSVYAGKAAEYFGESLKSKGEADFYASKGKAAESAGYGELFKGLGDMFQSGTRAADAYYKSKIDADVYSAVDAERTNFTRQLEQAGIGGTVPVSSADDMEFSSQSRRGGPVDILSPTARESMPEGIDRGIRDVNSVVAARANDKISETMYIQRLNSIAKSLRAQYPGHREYIDQQIAQTTGMNPANAYVRSMIQDMNAAATAARASQGKVESMLIDGAKKIPGFQNIYFGWKDGNITTEQAMEIYNKQEAWRYTYERIKAGRENLKGTIEERQLVDGQNLSTTVSQKVDTLFDSAMARIKPEVLEKLRNGDFTGVDPTEIQKVNSAMLAAKQGAFQAAWGEAVRLGWTNSTSLGAEEVKKRINAQLSIFDNFSDLINNQNGGAAFALVAQNKALLTAGENRMLKDKELGPYLTMSSAIQKNGGDKALEKLFQSGLGTGLMPATQAFIRDEKARWASGEINPQTGAPHTPNDIIEAAKKEKIPVPKLNNEVVKTLGLIYDPQVGDGMKTTMIKGLGSEQNKGFISQFGKDGWNTPDRAYRPGAKWVNGKNYVWSEATRPEIIAEVKKQDQTTQRNYIDWAEQTFAKELFGRDIKDFERISKHKGLVVTYDSENKRFGVSMHLADTRPKVDPNALPGGRILPGERVDQLRLQYESAKTTIENLNAGISGLKNVAELRNMDVDAYIFRQLRLSGATLEGTSIPSAMMKSMTSSATSKSNFQPEENPQRGSLSEFLKNPATTLPARPQNAPAGSRTRLRGNLTDEELIPGSISVEDVPLGQPLRTRR